MTFYQRCLILQSIVIAFIGGIIIGISNFDPKIIFYIGVTFAFAAIIAKWNWSKI